MDRPTLRASIDALLFTHPDYPNVGPTEEEADVAAVLESVETAHYGDGDVSGWRGFWGRCVCCEAPWPCESWRWAQALAVQFVGRATDRVFATAPSSVQDLSEPDVSDANRPPPARRVAPLARITDEELRRLRYPPDGDIERWVREGPPGHVNYLGTNNTGETA